MVFSETLAIVVSSTCMKVPSASASAVIASTAPVSGAGWLEPGPDDGPGAELNARRRGWRR